MSDVEAPTAVILAAGASSRMGQPKALIPWRGAPFVAHCITQAQRAGCNNVVVVAGAVALPADTTIGARVVDNPAWAEGQMSSVQTGLRAVPSGAVLLLTVDRPHVQPETVTALVAAWRAEPTLVWQPIFNARRGHPLVYPADVVAAVVDAPPGQTQRDVLARPDIAPRRRTLPCEDAATVDNLDRPEDLARLP